MGQGKVFARSSKHSSDVFEVETKAKMDDLSIPAHRRVSDKKCPHYYQLQGHRKNKLALSDRMLEELWCKASYLARTLYGVVVILNLSQLSKDTARILQNATRKNDGTIVCKWSFVTYGETCQTECPFRDPLGYLEAAEAFENKKIKREKPPLLDFYGCVVKDPPLLDESMSKGSREKRYKKFDSLKSGDKLFPMSELQGVENCVQVLLFLEKADCDLLDVAMDMHKYLSNRVPKSLVALTDVIKWTVETAWGISKNWLDNVLTGLIFMHGRQLAHLDLSPENIFMVSKTEKHWDISKGSRNRSEKRASTLFSSPSSLSVLTAKIGDFGCSRRYSDAMLVGRYGKPFYMAPEVADSKQINAELADCYAFGATMFSVLFGRPVFSDRENPLRFKKLHEFIDSLDLRPKMLSIILKGCICEAGKRMTFSAIQTAWYTDGHTDGFK